MTGAGQIERAADVIRDGELVVYPTETVYGLGADALDPAAIRRVFAVKQRALDDPISFAVANVDAATEYVLVSDRTRAFMEAFLPGPVTVVCERKSVVPDVLTGGRDRVGVRVPDHDMASALLRRVAPITATSANLSGAGSVTRPSQLDPSIREAVAVVLDGGDTPGGGSTVVDPDRNQIFRAGVVVDEVSTWLEE